MLRRLAWATLGATVLLAVVADFAASDRPLVLHLDGETYWLANVVDYDALASRTGAELRASMDEADWAVWAPIRHGPTGVRGDGTLRILEAPSSSHWLGTDDRGRDVMARLVHGTRTTVIVALGAVVLALALGTLLGALGAGRRGATDAVVVSICDVIGAVPTLVVLVAVQGLIGRGGMIVMIVLIALPRAADIARVVRAEVLVALAEPFCDAARAIGASELRVVVRQALPQARRALMVAAGVTAVTAVLGEAALSFLGFGVPAPKASWGELLAQAHNNELAWWLAIPAGVAITLVAAAVGALAQPNTSR